MLEIFWTSVPSSSTLGFPGKKSVEFRLLHCILSVVQYYVDNESDRNHVDDE